VISGSANFSDASTINNDENMVVINGNTMVADIYLGEFMRLWSHFYFRDIANKYATINALEAKNKKPKKSGKAKQAYSAYLVPNDSWTNDFFGKSFRKTQERLLFK
jgi:phosphatidylserine/phosphatidylglycerophosphate/cardiolipin synthase-like enzyme